MPRRPSKAAARGTEFHRLVELHNLGKVALDDATADRYDGVLEEAEDDGAGQDEPSSAPPWTVFESSRFATTKSRFTEVPFEVAVGPGSVRGKIDAVYEEQPGHWEIVDYKSGRKSENPARRVQLQAYAIAAAEGAISIDRPDTMAVSFAYFGGGELEEVSETVDDAWLEGARTEVERLVTVGAEGPWDPTPSTACRHCDFRVHCKVGSEWVANNPQER
jgi:DNA helicase-2/ATP-dependent DNA helicase PcrA